MPALNREQPLGGRAAQPLGWRVETSGQDTPAKPCNYNRQRLRDARGTWSPVPALIC